jgi:hypothetical protein
MIKPFIEKPGRGNRHIRAPQIRRIGFECRYPAPAAGGRPMTVPDPDLESGIRGLAGAAG